MTVLYRNIIPFLGNEYNIEATMGKIVDVYGREDNQFDFPYTRYAEILECLTHVRFINSEVTWIPDVMNGALTPTDMWFQAYGEVYGMEGHCIHAYDIEIDTESIATLDTWSVTDTDMSDYEGEEQISEDEENDIVEVVGVLVDLSNEIIDLTNEPDEIIDLTDDNEQ